MKYLFDRYFLGKMDGIEIILQAQNVLSQLCSFVISSLLVASIVIDDLLIKHVSGHVVVIPNKQTRFK
ncbi:MAG: hypothetical protein Ct9H300mP21_09180 [Pseudomonadota bacterium]|nr:MAG: hypothetical protein Ct9H300mP21_09180 [Pseudomonadota bacterium]